MFKESLVSLIIINEVLWQKYEYVIEKCKWLFKEMKQRGLLVIVCFCVLLYIDKGFGVLVINYEVKF